MIGLIQVQLQQFFSYLTDFTIYLSYWLVITDSLMGLVVDLMRTFCLTIWLND